MSEHLKSVIVCGVCAAVSLSAGAVRGQQLAKLTAADSTGGEEFGLSVSLSGDTALIGAGFDNDDGYQSGSAYVFRDVGGVWQQIAKLTADDAAPEDVFGRHLGIDGDTAIIGARGDDDAGDGSGAAYIFREIGGVWQQVAKLMADDAAAGQRFGWGISISGDTVLVGADGDSANTGAAYVIRDVGGVWQQIAKLTAADAAAGDQFGMAVSIDGDTAVVGAIFDDDAGRDAGAAYVFREIGGVWQQIAKLVGADITAFDQFGFGVSLSGDTAVIGATREDDGGSDAGAAYVFREVGGVWQQIAKLTADDAAASDAFGVAVSIDGDTAVVGASRADTGEGRTGAAYVFREIGGVWQQTEKLTAADKEEWDYFGVRLCLSGDKALIGAHWKDGTFPDSGAAYVFRVERPCAADFNGDGSVNTLDVLGFLNAWAAGDSSADFNGDGAVNTLDVLAFLNAWVSGC